MNPDEDEDPLFVEQVRASPELKDQTVEGRAELGEPHEASSRETIMYPWFPHNIGMSVLDIAADPYDPALSRRGRLVRRRRAARTIRYFLELRDDPAFPKNAGARAGQGLRLADRAGEARAVEAFMGARTPGRVRTGGADLRRPAGLTRSLAVVGQGVNRACRSCQKNAGARSTPGSTAPSTTALMASHPPPPYDGFAGTETVVQHAVAGRSRRHAAFFHNNSAATSRKPSSST